MIRANFMAHFMLTMVVEEQSFRIALAFVVARPSANRINVAPVIFRLWMDGRITINFGCGSLENTNLQTLRKAKHIDST